MAEPASTEVARASRSDHSPWNWLLLIPIVVPLLTPIYNVDSPRLWGFPRFYWLQFLFILVGVATTVTVYRMTRSGRPATTAPDASAASASAGSSADASADASADEVSSDE